METYDDWAQATDAELVAAVREQDRGALHELFLRHEPWLAARLAHRCADSSIVDEAISDTFLAVWRNASWRGEGEVAAWLWGIAIRSLLHRLRPRKNVFERLVTLRAPMPCRPRKRCWRACSTATWASPSAASPPSCAPSSRPRSWTA